MSMTKAKWYRSPTSPARADPPTRGKPIYPGLLDADRKRKGRDNRKGRPQRQPGGAPSYKPYDYPTRPRPERERPARPIDRGGYYKPDLKPKPRFRPGFGTPLWLPDALDYAGQWYDDWMGRYPYPVPGPGAGWRLRARCITRPLSSVNASFTTNNYPANTTHNQTNQCLSGQASPGPGFAIVGNNAKGILFQQSVFVPAISAWREARVVSYDRPNTGSSYSVPSFSMPGLDPNIIRISPGRPLEPGFGTPLRRSPDEGEGGDPMEQVNSPNPEGSPYQPDSRYAFEIGIATGYAPPLDPAAGIPVRPGVPPVVVKRPIRPPRTRQRRKREKQRKAITKTRAIAIGLYRAVDAASEGAEIIGAVFDALPDDVKKRWKEPDRMGDSFGQYGLGGADWKLRALWYNWHKVDVEQAVKNIIKNQLSDSISP